jgi:hypothetical protein
VCFCVSVERGCDCADCSIVILLDISVVSVSAPKIGAPKPYVAGQAKEEGPAKSRSSSSAVLPASSSVIATPLTELSPYNTKWTIRVR